MERWVGRVALVTGASAGIGAAVVESLTKAGMKVVGCARNITSIQELSEKLKGEKGSLTAVQCDVTKEDQVLSMFDQIKKDHGGVDVCINNAGKGSTKTSLLSGETSEWKNMLDLNVMAVCMCTREAVKSMRERGVDDGHVIHINSIMGHKVFGGGRAHFYCASKFAVGALTEGLRNELREINSHIRVSQISIGLTKTTFAVRCIGEEAAKEFYSKQCLQPTDVADAIVYALSAPPHVQVHDILIRPTEQLG